MKNIILFGLIILFIISCDDLLDLQPTNSISSENAILNESDLQNSIKSCYDAFQADGYYGRNLIMINEIGSDNAYNGGTILEYDQFNKNNVQQDNRYLEEIWATPYIAINRCNMVIYYMDKLEDITESKKEEYLAEVLFLRALNYYNLTRLFRDVPLKLKPTIDTKDFNVPVSNQSEVYEKILEDLTFANNKLKNTNSFLATDDAVKTLLAKINLELDNYQEAINYANEVINSDKKLLEDYSELYTSENNLESIFELEFTELLSDKNRIAEYCYPNNLGGRYEIAPEIELLNSFESGDHRLNFFLGNTPYCNKYESITSGADNVFIFRLAELYLLRAEARTRNNGTISQINSDINKIRNRAGLTSIYSNSYTELLQIIENERRLEFAFEGHRRFDLIRTNRASEVLGITTDSYYYKIPLSEINTNDEIN